MLKWALNGAAALAFMAALAGDPAEAQQKTLSIGTGGTGGVYYPLGGAIANVLSKALPNVQATAEVTGGSIDNLKLIGAGQSEMAFTMADAAYDAVQGIEKFKNNKVALQTLLARLDGGSWPVLDPLTLNTAVDAMDVERRTLVGRRVPGAFAQFTPSAFPRRYDGRDTDLEAPKRRR